MSKLDPASLAQAAQDIFQWILSGLSARLMGSSPQRREEGADLDPALRRRLGSGGVGVEATDLSRC